MSQYDLYIYIYSVDMLYKNTFGVKKVRPSRKHQSYFLIIQNCLTKKCDYQVEAKTIEVQSQHTCTTTIMWTQPTNICMHPSSDQLTLSMMQCKINFDVQQSIIINMINCHL